VTPETDDAEAYLGGLVQPLLRKMSAFPAPTFAAAQGACLGVGLGMHRTLDLIYTAELISGTETVAPGMFSRAMPAVELLANTREL
jgi:2-(1,2-epoxy-1,2-dihydrophenyl)acetyl-CoA isomerase